MTSHKKLPSRRRVLAGAAAAASAFAAPTIVRAQAKGPLKVGMLLPRSGFEAAIGQDCQRGVDIAPPILKSLGLPDLTVMNGDTESNVDVARERAEKLISEGAQLLVGAFDSGQTTAIAQVAEQKGIPLVINIAGAPAITSPALTRPRCTMRPGSGVCTSKTSISPLVMTMRPASASCPPPSA